MKKQENKGITLIALVITIIVMLILVVVTINVATDGGLIKKAKQATMDTERETIREQILSMTEYDDYGNIDLSKTYDAIKIKFGENKVSIKEPIQEGTTLIEIEIIGKSGTYKYQLSGKNGIEDVKEKEDKFAGKTYTDFTGNIIIKFENNNIVSLCTKDPNSEDEETVEGIYELSEDGLIAHLKYTGDEPGYRSGGDVRYLNDKAILFSEFAILTTDGDFSDFVGLGGKTFNIRNNSQYGQITFEDINGIGSFNYTTPTVSGYGNYLCIIENDEITYFEKHNEVKEGVGGSLDYIQEYKYFAVH